MAKVTAVHSGTHKIKTLAHSPVAAVEVDDVTIIGTRVCIAYADVDAAAEGQFIYAADEVEVPKAAVAIAEGEIAYWDPLANNFTNVSTSNTKCGMWIRAAIAGDATGFIELDNSVAL